MKTVLIYEALCNLPFGVKKGDLFTEDTKVDLDDPDNFEYKIYRNQNGTEMEYNISNEKEFFKIRKETYENITAKDVINHYGEFNRYLYWEYPRQYKHKLFDELKNISLERLRPNQIKNINSFLYDEDEDLRYDYLIYIVEKYDTYSNKKNSNCILSANKDFMNRICNDHFTFSNKWLLLYDKHKSDIG